MNENDIDIEDAITHIDEGHYQDLLIFACQLLSKSGNSSGVHFSSTRVLFDILDAMIFPEIKEAMEKDYERR